MIVVGEPSLLVKAGVSTLGPLADRYVLFLFIWGFFARLSLEVPLFSL